MRRGTRHRPLARLALALALGAAPAAARAQAPDPWPGRLEVGVGAGVVGASTLGSTVAALTPNQPAREDPFVLFRTETTLDAAPSLDLALGVDLTRRIAVEGRVTYRRPALSVALSDDAERASGTGTVRERLSEYVVDVGVVFSVRRFALGGGRTVPFVHGGAGYLRQLHEGRLIVETGTTGHVGGGVKVLLAERDGWLKGVGVRAQAGLSWRSGGVTIEDGLRTAFVAGGGLFVRF